MDVIGVGDRDSHYEGERREEGGGRQTILFWTRVGQSFHRTLGVRAWGQDGCLLLPGRRSRSPSRTPRLEEPGYLSGAQAEIQPLRNKPSQWHPGAQSQRTGESTHVSRTESPQRLMC